MKTRPQRAQRQDTGDEHRRTIKLTHTTPYIRTARSPDARCVTRSPAHNPAHHGIFTSVRSPAHATRTLADRNLTESPTLGFILAAPKELIAC